MSKIERNRHRPQRIVSGKFYELSGGRGRIGRFQSVLPDIISPAQQIKCKRQADNVDESNCDIERKWKNRDVSARWPEFLKIPPPGPAKLDRTLGLSRPLESDRRLAQKPGSLSHGRIKRKQTNSKIEINQPVERD